MKNVITGILLSFVMISSAQLSIFIPEPYGDNFIESELIQAVELIPLQLEKYGMIRPDFEMKVDEDNYFILDDRSEQCVYRFNASGELMNTINKNDSEQSAQDMPNLKNPVKFSLNPYLKHIDIYNFEDSKIMQYDYDGKLVSSMGLDINPSDFVQDKKGNYWIYMGWNNIQTQFRLLKKDQNGNTLDRKMRLITNCTPTEGFSFYPLKDKILFWELLGNAVYEIIDNEVYPRYIFNFNTYQLPRDYHEMLGSDSFTQINQTGYYTMKKYLENEDFSYFHLNFRSMQQREMFHILYDRKTDQLFIYTENSAIGAFDKAQALTAENELVFLVSPRKTRQMLSYVSDFVPAPFMGMEDELRSLRNPAILKIKLRSLSEAFNEEEDQFNAADTLFFDY